MDLAQAIEYGGNFFSARFLGKRIPMVVSMVVTNRCNYSCAYCDRWDGRGYQLECDEILTFLDDMAELGTKRVIFTGGEPLIRKDIIQIIGHAKSHGLKVNLNSNGTLVPRLMSQLSQIDGLTISIDGDRDTHDGIRGEGAFDIAIEAVRAAKKHPNIRIRLSAVISRDSIGAEDALLDVAAEEGVEVFFQPAEHRLLGSDGVNPLAPPVDRYRETIDHLIRRKKDGAPIANSASALKYLRDWPDGDALACAGSKLFCRIDHDGRVMICGRMGEYEESFSALDLGFKDAFLSLNTARCPTCWCASRVEVNQAFALRPDAITGLAGAS
jgi:MoaA/NifB/PqqE/SkfB family radical SAM enzyme